MEHHVVWSTSFCTFAKSSLDHGVSGRSMIYRRRNTSTQEQAGFSAARSVKSMEAADDRIYTLHGKMSFVHCDHFLLFMTLTHISSSPSLASPAGKELIAEMALSAYS